MSITSIQQRLEKQAKLAQTLIEAGYINSYELYQDPFGIFEKEFDEALPEEVLDWLPILSMILMNPVLLDNIEDNEKHDGTIDDSERMRIRNILASSGELYAFYESNQLQSSNLATALQVTKMIIHLLPDVFMSEQKEKFEVVRFQFNGTDNPDGLEAFRYKRDLNNQEKRVLEKQIVAFLEQFILLFVKK